MLQRLLFGLFIRPFVTLFIGVRVVGREHLPADDPFLMVANHASHLDAITIQSLFPGSRLRRIRPVAAADYWTRSPFMTWFSRTFINVLPIARRKEPDAPDPREQMVDALRAGQSLLLFPEGTRGRGESMGDFKPGVAHVIETLPEVPVVPVLLVNLGRSLPKGAWIPLPLFCEVRIGPPRRIQGDQTQILAAVQRSVTDLQDL